MGRILIPLFWFWGWCIALMPRSIKNLKARFIGLLLRKVGVRSRVVIENLERAYPGKDQAQAREQLFVEAYVAFGHLLLELLLLFGGLRRFAKQSIVEGFEHWEAAHARGKGVLFLSSHLGNWEIMASTGGMKGIDLMLVTKRLKPVWLHRWVESSRAQCGVTGAYEPQTFKRVLGHLKAGKTVGMIIDQYAGPPVGVRVPFFGTPVGTLSVLAMVARRTGAPVIPVVNYRDASGRFRVEIGAPLHWMVGTSPAQEIALNTAQYSQVMEAGIRRHPAQWLWVHRRFKGDLSPLREGEWEAGRDRGQEAP